MAARCAAHCSRAARECGKRGILSFSKESIPLTPPRERTRGLAPRPRTLADRHLKSCAACGLHSRWQLCCLTDVAYPLRVIGRGVRGFATSLCELLPVSTAPYYREARVMGARRQASCGRGIAALTARWMKQMLQFVGTYDTVITRRCTNGRRLATSSERRW